LLCNRNVKTKCSSTSNLWSHLSLCHPSEHNAIRPVAVKKGSTETNGAQSINGTPKITSFAKLATDSARHKTITETIAKFICKDMLPIHLVSKPGFKELMRCLEPRYQLPSESHFKRYAIPQLYKQVADWSTENQHIDLEYQIQSLHLF
jgi:hypothetical protein